MQNFPKLIRTLFTYKVLQFYPLVFLTINSRIERLKLFLITLTNHYFLLSVGPLPDMLKPSSDCRTILIALEAEAFARNGTLVDPEGGVGLLKFQDKNISSSNHSYKRLNFTLYNDR